MDVINPATTTSVKHFEEQDINEFSKIIEDSHHAYISQWKNTPFQKRAELMKNAAAVLRDRKNEFSGMMAEEMGKPVTQGVAEVEKCAWVCDYYADNAEKFLEDRLISTDAARSYVTFEPLGTVLAIMPWNFPFWQVFRFAAPNLMAGNTGVLKHASNVPGCALAIEDIFRDAGFPENVFRTILVNSKQMDRVIAHPKIAAVTLTGSTKAGKAVAKTAGGYLKKTVLELGGSDPYVILEDADIEQAVDICVKSRLINSGQSCIAAKRFVVTAPVYDEFKKKFVEKMSRAKLGHPMEETSELGPLAREDLREALHEQVRKSIEKGAELLCGGEIPDMEGFYYPPTVLENVKKGMPAYEEELFGPVASLIKAKDEEEAINIANDTIYGLGAAVFTRDVKRGEEIAATKLQAGCCFVNGQVKSDPRLPFGGIKESGYGRELSYFGIQEFVNIKTVWVS